MKTWRRLEFILNLARELGVNIAGIAIILQMRERMEEMNRQMQDFVDYVRTEMLTKMQQGMPASEGAIVALRRPMVVPPRLRVSARAIALGQPGYKTCLLRTTNMLLSRRFMGQSIL